jgi:hypothetical protein
MKRRFLRRRAGDESLPESDSPPADASMQDPAPGIQRACCCPAWPVVQVILPPAVRRPHPVDLWLCGHHYRLSRDALAAVGATVRHLPGTSDVVAAALSGVPDRSRAEIS